MLTRTEYEALLKKLDQLSKEMETIRQVLLGSKPRNGGRSREAWDNLSKLSEEISEKWQDSSVVEEIRAQRSSES